MSFQILKAFSHSWSALLFWGPQGAGPVYGEADRRIISLLIMRPRWRTRIGGILINKIMSTRWHLRPHLIRLDCGIQCFERHDGYERFMGKFSCSVGQCIYTSQSRSTDQTMTRWTSLSYVVPQLRRKWSCFNNEDWAEHLTVLCVVEQLFLHCVSPLYQKITVFPPLHCQHNQSGGR